MMGELLPVLASMFEKPDAPKLDLRRAAAATSMWAFDDAIIAPMMDCAGGATQYYDEGSSHHVLPRVRVPTLFVSAANDPIAPADVIDSTLFTSEEGSAPLLLAVTSEGGHSMTWPEGWRGRGRSWSCDVLLEWVRTLHRGVHARL